MAKSQFETELLKIEYANSALDVSSIIDRLDEYRQCANEGTRGITSRSGGRGTGAG